MTKHYLHTPKTTVSHLPEKGKISWESPSNIALIKYWGKKGLQLPRNASLSITLKDSVSLVEMDFKKSLQAGGSLDFFFEGKENRPFQERTNKYLKQLIPYFPFLKQLHLTVNSRNSFPHSAGIASSASSMSAFALCIGSLETFSPSVVSGDFLQKASYMARLGSGSATRSVYGNMAAWGQHPMLNDSSDLYAIPLNNTLASDFLNIRDAVVIVNSKPKPVSSSHGHTLMENHPLAENRIQQAGANFSKLLDAINNNDWPQFSRIVENEALSLHAMMLSSIPGFTLLQQETLDIIEAVQKFRETENIPLTFTLDAGPNVHLLYPQTYKDNIHAFIHNQIKPLTENGHIIYDRMGNGPVLKEMSPV
ncbi:MAG: diphosphomevalonate decarboxylase [Bacteroidales bacterium]